ncbi:hypothetical protein B7992_01195 [Fibrobacter sp. UWH1]|nr:hypothetical protein B7992_01195 [Fibrobacter sp. UWH1]
MLMMNNKMITALVLAGGVASWAQLLYEKPVDEKVDRVSLERPSRMGESVKKFVDTQKASKKVKKVSVKSDLLGRSRNSTLTYEVDVASQQKMKVLVNDVMVEHASLETESGSFDYSASADSKNYELNGVKMSESQFQKKADNSRKKLRKNRRKFKAPRVEYMTASEIEQEISSNENVYVSEYKGVKYDGLDFGEDTYLEDFYIRTKSGIDTYAWNKGYYGQGVGIYYSEGGCVPDNYVNHNYFTQMNNCPNGVSSHAIGVARVLQSSTGESHIYGSAEVIYPEDPDKYPVPIYIGSQSWGYVYDYPYYCSADAIMDNYIYEYGVAQFVAAGNDYRYSYVSTPARSMNAVAVGAVSPIDYKYMVYSSSRNGYAHNDKPEVANFTNFYFRRDLHYSDENGSYNGRFNGTSAATPYTAGMAALLLSKYPSLKWHPEMLKAVMLVGSTRDVGNTDYDYDGIRTFKAGIPMLDRLTTSPLFKNRYWYGANNTNFDKNGRISFTESNIQKGKRYRAAISWLSSGEYVMNNQRLPQDIDLVVRQNGTIIASSASSYNPFELVDFVAPNSGEIEVVITRYRNSSASENVKLGFSILQVD